MLLMIDTTNLDVDFEMIDLRLSDEADLSVATLCSSICKGIEEIGGCCLPEKSRLTLYLQKENGMLVKLEDTAKVRVLNLEQYATLILKK